MDESHPNFEQYTENPTLKNSVKATYPTECLVPGFEKCKLDEVLEFLGLEKEYGTDELFVDGNKVPCTDADNLPSYITELNEKGFPDPDALLYDSLPESLFRGLKILGKVMGDYNKQVELVNKWKTKLLAEEALPILGSKDGVDFIIRLANDRQTKINLWKEGGTGKEPTKYKESLRQQVTLGKPPSVMRNEKGEEIEAGSQTATLNPVLIRKFLTEDEWESSQGRIAFYRKELEKTRIQLKEEGKKCEGCALNPYKAKFAKILHNEFKDKSIIPDSEIASIKKKLQVDYLQVGIVDGSVYVR